MFGTKFIRLSRAALASIAALGAASVALASDSAPIDGKVVQLLKTRLPKTAVTKVDCAKIDGLCEITAGSNLFYVDTKARYLVIGRVYDMETRQDVTAARLLEMNPDMLVGGAVKANNAASAGADTEEGIGSQAGTRVERTAAVTPPKYLSLASLPKDGAIVWGNPGGQPVTIFTDFHCAYCKALVNVLGGMNVRVIERPISVLGSRDIADKVYCSRNREEALHHAYAGERLPMAQPCNTAGLDANEAFAKQNGLTGTPVIVRSDGAVIEGYRPREFLESWLKGAKS